MPAELILAIVVFVFALIGAASWRGIKSALTRQEAAIAAGRRRSANDWTPGNVSIAKWVTVGLTALAVFFVVLSCIQVVSTRNVGVETAFGSTEGHLSNGLHLTAPWVNVTEMDAAIQTDSYARGDCLNVRIANQQTACVDISIRWRIRTDQADELFQNYHTFDHVRDSLVTRELISAVNNQFRSYNPLNSVQLGTSASGAPPNPSLSALAQAVTAQMRREIGGQIEVLNTIIPYISFDDQTQSRINQLQQQIALTRIAQQAKQTNTAQATANQALASSVKTSPNVLVSKCFDILQELVKNDQPVPPGFSCWPGGSLAGVIANGSGK